MRVINVSNARKNLYNLVNEVNEYSDPVTIVSNKGKNAVLISEDDWNAIQETLYLNQIPGVAESIIDGGKIPLEDCLEEDALEW
ncbi:MAG: type II toxin-antitoxin system Phd/YefM family antitoxin [Eubacterium sp.]|nr:type II toxin-antitoxin system Phd/YefM family antitoxin [Eubacterium sp.]